MRLIYTSASISERLLFWWSQSCSHQSQRHLNRQFCCFDSSLSWFTSDVKRYMGERRPKGGVISADSGEYSVYLTAGNRLQQIIPFFRLFESNEKYRYNSPFYQWHSHFWLFQILALVYSKGKNTIINLSITLYIYQHCYICPVGDLCPRTVFCVMLQEKGYPFQWHARPCQITGRIHSRRHETQAKNVGNEAGE